MINLLTFLFPGNDTMSLQMRVSVFHVLNDLERVADHIVNVGYSICNPVGDDKEIN